MPIKDLPLTRTPRALRAAATATEWVRVRGVVTHRALARCGPYWQAVLHIETPAGLVRVTADTLGGSQPGTTVEIATLLTGRLDLPQQLYHGDHTRLLHLTPPA